MFPAAKKVSALKDMSFNQIAEYETKFRTCVTEKSPTVFGFKATEVRWRFRSQTQYQRREGNLNYICEIVCIINNKSELLSLKLIKKHSRKLQVL